MHQSISFSEIPEHGLQLEPNDLSWFPDDLVKRQGPVSVKLFLTKKGENKIDVQGRLQAIFLLDCDRCLTEYAYTVDVPIRFIVEVNDPTHHWRVQDLDRCGTDIEIVVLNEPLIDIGDLLRQQILLVLPEKQLCGNSCRGLCNTCGVNLNKESCSCAGDVKDSPFSVLAQFRKNK